MGKKVKVEVNEKKIELIRELGEATLQEQEIVDKALDVYLADLRKKQMLRLLGTDFFAEDLKKMRS